MTIVHHEAGRSLNTGQERSWAAALLVAFSAGTRPAWEWAKTKRPPWKDQSVHLRYFRLSGKELYRWNGGVEVPLPHKAAMGAQ